jgi:hypothetical protein
MANKIGAKKMLVYCSGIALALGVACVTLLPEARVAILRTLMPGVCISEDRTTISNLSGMEFKIVYTNCDTLTKEEDISVYVSRAANNRKSLLSRWSNRHTLLFRYDPGNYDSALPSIRASDGDKILISIPRVSSVSLQRGKWQNVSVDYKIGYIEFQ